MKKNDLVIYEFKQIDIYDLTEEQQKELAKQLIQNVNIRQLEEKIHDCILNLSGVGGPNFMADACYIALDNQKRLELVHQLLYYLDIFKSDIKYMKKNIDARYMDSDRIYSFLNYTKHLIDTIYDYGEYRKEDFQTQIKQLKDAGNKTILNYISVETIEEPEELDIDNFTEEDWQDKEKVKIAVEQTMTGLKDTLKDVVDILKDTKDSE